jgi:hypothetical protein
LLSTKVELAIEGLHVGTCPVPDAINVHLLELPQPRNNLALMNISEKGFQPEQCRDYIPYQGEGGYLVVVKDVAGVMREGREV